jgi:hypothetical protein
MKTLMLTGAMGGFVTGLALGFARRTEWPSMLWHACAAATATGLSLGWWGRVWLRGLQASLEDRRAQEAAARQQTPSTTIKKK